jgi:hypothetical protein
MDTTKLLVQLLPACALPKLKFLVTVLGGIATSVLVTYPHVDHRVAIASAALTALGTYLTPNVQPVKLVGNVAKQEVDQSTWITYSNCPCATESQDADNQVTEKPEPAPVTVQTQAPVAPPVPAPVKEVGV